MKTKQLLDRRERENENMRYVVEGVIGAARAVNVAQAAKFAVRFKVPLEITHRVLIEHPQWKPKLKSHV